MRSKVLFIENCGDCGVEELEWPTHGYKVQKELFFSNIFKLQNQITNLKN